MRTDLEEGGLMKLERRPDGLLKWPFTQPLPNPQDYRGFWTWDRLVGGCVLFFLLPVVLYLFHTPEPLQRLANLLALIYGLCASYKAVTVTNYPKFGFFLFLATFFGSLHQLFSIIIQYSH